MTQEKINQLITLLQELQLADYKEIDNNQCEQLQNQLIIIKPIN